MGSRTGENLPDDPLHAYWKVCDELKVEAAAKWEARRATQKAEDELAGERAARVRAEEALRLCKRFFAGELVEGEHLKLMEALAAVPEKDKPCGECEGCIDGFDCCAASVSAS